MSLVVIIITVGLFRPAIDLGLNGRDPLNDFSHTIHRILNSFQQVFDSFTIIMSPIGECKLSELCFHPKLPSQRYLSAQGVSLQISFAMLCFYVYP